MQLLAHKINQTPISQRRDDGYINATALCTASSKRLNDYKRLDTTEAFLQELSTVTGIPVTGLLEVRRGGNQKGLQGTWAHPQVAIHLAMWCSPAFAVQVTQWVVSWMQGNSSCIPADIFEPGRAAALRLKQELQKQDEYTELLLLALSGMQSTAKLEGHLQHQRDLETISRQIGWLRANMTYHRHSLAEALAPIFRQPQMPSER